MLKTTQPKTLAEASVDKTWGTGISIRDKDALNTSRWESEGCLWRMLMKIREDNT